MNIGLLGFGVVGRGVYEITTSRTDMQVTKVLCLEDISLPDAEAVKDFKLILEDKSIDTVVEAMGGLHPAYDFVRAAIEAGKNVVTSNKALVATFYDELLPLAREKGVMLRCTAAVGGGIGWLSELERARRVEKLHFVGGIMNGTCNYILDSMTRLGLTYDDALRQAQKLGYAEANPSTDVDGIDTWHKLIISSNVAFGISLDKSGVPVAGIRQITAEDVEEFKAHGFVCKLVSTGKNENGKIQAYVQPTLFGAGELEAAVPTNYNLITLDGETSGRQSLYGQGAGRYPTAYNVVEDLVDLTRGNGFYAPYGQKVQADNDEKRSYYIRGGDQAAFAGRVAANWGRAIVTEPISVMEVHNWLKANAGAFIAALPEA
ncbi:MAG: homoserine dehydrogenase [Oscillospiraceae bacterium]|nr:homoserine dehydrogenase [Oscillospiraceae bacterium]